MMMLAKLLANIIECGAVVVHISSSDPSTAVHPQLINNNVIE